MPKLARRLTALCLLTTPLLFAVPSGLSVAQDLTPPDSVSSRLDRLEQNMNELQRQVYQRNVAGDSGAPTGAPMTPGTQALDVQVRMDQLESEIRDLTGRVEETQYGISQLKTRLDKMQSDNEVRFQALEHPGSAPPAGGGSGGGANGNPNDLPPPGGGTLSPPGDHASPGGGPSAVEPNAGPPPDDSGNGDADSAAPSNGSPQSEYSYAFNLLRAQKYADSQAAFNSFLKKHPRDPLAGNAQYWLGESFFAQNQFQQAAAIFAQGFARYPQSPKATDNLLKLGISLSNIDKKKEACAVFAKLDTYPKILPALKQREQKEKQRAHCGGASSD